MKWLPLGLAALACVFFILMMIFLMVSRRRKKKLKSLLNANDEEYSITEMDNQASAINTENEMAAKERRVMEEIHAAQQTRDQELRKGLQEFTEQNPEIVAQLIRTWVRGDDDDS
jgi:flagellar M-ring protein FliF